MSKYAFRLNDNISYGQWSQEFNTAYEAISYIEKHDPLVRFTKDIVDIIRDIETSGYSLSIFSARGYYRVHRLSEYEITGILRNGKRFKAIRVTQPWNYNIWKGTLWVLDHYTGKRNKVRELCGERATIGHVRYGD